MAAPPSRQVMYVSLKEQEGARRLASRLPPLLGYMVAGALFWTAALLELVIVLLHYCCSWCAWAVVPMRVQARLHHNRVKRLSERIAE